MLELNARIVDKKKHTVGYIVNGAKLNRNEVVKLAARNWVKDVKVMKNKGKKYVTSTGSKKLYSLPEVSN